MPDESLRQALGFVDREFRISLVEKPDRRLGEDPVAARNEAVVQSLSQAVEEVEKLLGKDWKAWQWGRLHHSALEHPITALVDEKTRTQWNVGPALRGGSAETVGFASYRQSDFRQLAGGAFRTVIDVGNWDNSLAMNSPGHSGDPANSHYRDLFPLWAKDQGIPLLYRRSQIEVQTEQRIRLRPGRRAFLKGTAFCESPGKASYSPRMPMIGQPSP